VNYKVYKNGAIFDPLCNLLQLKCTWPSFFSKLRFNCRKKICLPASNLS